MAINHVTLSGNIAGEPTLRITNGGNPVLNFVIVVDDRRRNPKPGASEECPNFFDCNMFGERVLRISKMIGKGSKIAVEGRLRYKSWTNGGERRSKVSVVVDDLVCMSPLAHDECGCDDYDYEVDGE